MDIESASKSRLRAEDLEPDYRFWADKDTWQLSEAAKLLCGRDPLGRYPGRPRYNAAAKVIGVIDLAFAAVKEGTLPSVRAALIPNHVVLEPQAFILWASKSGLEIPCGLKRVLESEKSTNGSSKILLDVAKERAIAVARTLWMVQPDLSLSSVLSHRAMKYIVADERFTTTQIAEWVTEYQPIG